MRGGRREKLLLPACKNTNLLLSLYIPSLRKRPGKLRCRPDGLQAAAGGSCRGSSFPLLPQASDELRVFVFVIGV
jgi:hypothetical protein